MGERTYDSTRAVKSTVYDVKYNSFNRTYTATGRQAYAGEYETVKKTTTVAEKATLYYKFVKKGTAAEVLNAESQYLFSLTKVFNTRRKMKTVPQFFKPLFVAGSIVAALCVIALIVGAIGHFSEGNPAQMYNWGICKAINNVLALHTLAPLWFVVSGLWMALMVVVDVMVKKLWSKISLLADNYYKPLPGEAEKPYGKEAYEELETIRTADSSTHRRIEYEYVWQTLWPTMVIYVLFAIIYATNRIMLVSQGKIIIQILNVCWHVIVIALLALQFVQLVRFIILSASLRLYPINRMIKICNNEIDNLEKMAKDMNLSAEVRPALLDKIVSNNVSSTY